jgi:hypothetical protein
MIIVTGVPLYIKGWIRSGALKMCEQSYTSSGTFTFKPFNNGSFSSSERCDLELFWDIGFDAHLFGRNLGCP